MVVISKGDDGIDRGWVGVGGFEVEGGDGVV